MLTLSPQVGELLLQATQSQDLEEALERSSGTTLSSNSLRSRPRFAAWRSSGDVPLPRSRNRPKTSIPMK